MTDFPQRPSPGSNASRHEYEAWLEPLAQEYRSVGEEDRPSNPDANEFSARRAAQVQHLAALIRQSKEQRVAVPPIRRYGWWLAAAASTLAFVGASAWFLNSSPLANVDAGAGATPNYSTEGVVAPSNAPAQAVVAEAVALREVAGRVVASHSNGNTELVESQTALRVGDEVSTTADSFLSLEVGLSRVDLAGASTLKLVRVEPRDQVYALEAGRVDLNIPRVPGETRSIAVHTADSVVSVKGTVFSVEVVDPGDSPKTVVHVTRGVVSVQNLGQEYLVHAGETFSSRERRVSNPSQGPSSGHESAQGIDSESDADAEHAEDSASVALRATSKRGVQAKRNAVARAARSEKAETARDTNAQPTSRLAEQNQLFAQAVEARKRGDTEQARRLLNDLLQRFPSSPLRASALLERGNLK